MSEIIYKINNNDMITYISSSTWKEFASENEGSDLLEENILNKSIWNFISDQDTSEIYNLAVDKVRVTGEKISIPFRCDAPEYRRLFIMEIKKPQKDIVQFNSILKRIESRTSVKFLESKTERTDDLLKICSWCRKVEIPHTSNWVEVEEAVVRLELYKLEKLPMITHTICNHCYEKLEKDLE